jgi:hypothetical protein
VYKRFAKVTIYDNIWSFQFEEPHTTPPMEPSFSWVLKPKWVRDMAVYRNAHTAAASERSGSGGSGSGSGSGSSSGSGSGSLSPSESWCNFMLERSRGGEGGIGEDLSRLPSVVPVLLGRQAVDPDCSPEEEDGKWVLAWGEKVFSIARSGLESPAMEAGARGSHHLRRGRDAAVSGSLVGTYFDSYRSVISISRPLPPHASSHRGTDHSHRAQGETQTWQFLTVCFDPSRAARGAFEGHTKKPWTGKKYHTKSFYTVEDPSPTVLAEEISLFFQINEQLEPVLSPRGNNSGWLHAVLPTKLKLPFAMNLQASWLLSVDRQEVQSLTENAWNHCLVSQVRRYVYAYAFV